MEAVVRFINLIQLGMVAYGGLTIFQGGTEIASNRKQGRTSMGGEWWGIVEGFLWFAAGTGSFLAMLFNGLL